mmetsp:Transcript_8949/g.19509  ORF Transcript_8949/g.19509 Transcript_8949/m.19509 type:complete len:229 (+) Transcript_8949:743-1429(+)
MCEGCGSLRRASSTEAATRAARPSALSAICQTSTSACAALSPCAAAASTTCARPKASCASACAEKSAGCAARPTEKVLHSAQSTSVASAGLARGSSCSRTGSTPSSRLSGGRSRVMLPTQRATGPASSTRPVRRRATSVRMPSHFSSSRNPSESSTRFASVDAAESSTSASTPFAAPPLPPLFAPPAIPPPPFTPPAPPPAPPSAWAARKPSSAPTAPPRNSVARTWP